MSGMVGVICDDTARYSLFQTCLVTMHSPVNTQIQFAIGSDRSVGRNSLVKKMMEYGCEWLWFVDDDHAFPPSTLNRLLETELDVVGALYCQRQLPFSPIAYSEKWEDGRYKPLFLPECPADAPIRVRATGTSGLLVRAEVFHAIEYPWFQHTTEQSEDLRFCDILYDLDIPVYVHTGVRLGHISPSVVWPNHTGEEWQIGFSVADGFSLAIGIDPEPVQTEDEEPAVA